MVSSSDRTMNLSMSFSFTIQKEAFVNEEKALVEELELKEEAVRLLKRKNREHEMDRDTLSRKIQNW